MVKQRGGRLTHVVTKTHTLHCYRGSEGNLCEAPP